MQNPESEAVKMSNDKELDEAYKKLENISGDEKLRRLSELRLKAILDEKATLECGREAGLKEGMAKRKSRADLQKERQNGKLERISRRRKSKTIRNCKKSYKAWNKC